MNDREKLIELLRCGYAEHTVCSSDGYPITKYVSKMVDDDTEVILADYLIDNGVTVQRWIPVTERLPEKWGEYLVMIEGDKRSTTLYYEWADKYWFDFPNGRKFVVTHWMPLPEPPKEE